MKAIFLLILLLVSPVSASIYLHQGDTAYWGDKVDLTGVYGWQCQVAWWNSSNNGGYPSQIVDVCSYSTNILVTPERFPEGRWYKWDGKVSNSENDLAFKVAATRPVTPTPVATAAPVVNSTPTPEPTTPFLVSLTPTVVSTISERPTTIKATLVPSITPTSVFDAASKVMLPTATPEEPDPYLGPNLPPAPIILIMIFVGGLVVYWWVKGTM